MVALVQISPPLSPLLYGVGGCDLGKEGFSSHSRARAGGFGLLVPETVTPHLRSTWLQSHQFGWGAVLVQSRNSWKHWEFPNGLMAHQMEVKGEASHWSDLFCFFRDECVQGDALVMCTRISSWKSEMQSAAVGRGWLAHLFPGVSRASLG